MVIIWAVNMTYSGPENGKIVIFSPQAAKNPAKTGALLA